MTKISLFDPIDIGDISLRNRIVMAPMTRSRADVNDAPDEIVLQYYKQRANAGLIITEGTQPSINGKGYPRTPGIHTALQINAWKQITDAIHQAGGKIFMQLMHVGRIAHPFNKDLAAETIAPSAIQAAGEIYTDQAGLQKPAMPRALKTQEIPLVINEFKQATINAFSAGFDGVELHAASGYLPMQFLSTNSNIRTDRYGGSVVNRIRFVIETLEAMSSVKGAQKIGIRIWPGSTFNDIADADPIATYTELLKQVNQLNLGYVHVIRSPEKSINAFKLVREHFNGISMINGGFDYESAQKALVEKLGDLVSYATWYIANPDLIARFRHNSRLAIPDKNTFYTPGAEGYIDYPCL